jgi:hypothetical protein
VIVGNAGTKLPFVDYPAAAFRLHPILGRDVLAGKPVLVRPLAEQRNTAPFIVPSGFTGAPSPTSASTTPTATSL